MSNEVVVRDDALAGWSTGPRRPSTRRCARRWTSARREVRMPDSGSRRSPTLTAPATSPYHQESPQVIRRRRVIVVGHAGRRHRPCSASRSPARRAATRSTCSAAVLAAVWLVGGLLSGPVHLGYGRGQSARSGLAAGRRAGLRGLRRRRRGGELDPGAAPRGRRRHQPRRHRLAGAHRRASRSSTASARRSSSAARSTARSGCAARRCGRRSVYVAATAASGNVMLVFAAALMGTVFALRAAGHPRHPRLVDHPRHLVDA